MDPPDGDAPPRERRQPNAGSKDGRTGLRHPPIHPEMRGATTSTKVPYRSSRARPEFNGGTAQHRDPPTKRMTNPRSRSPTAVMGCAIIRRRRLHTSCLFQYSTPTRAVVRRRQCSRRSLPGFVCHIVNPHLVSRRRVPAQPQRQTRRGIHHQTRPAPPDTRIHPRLRS